MLCGGDLCPRAGPRPSGLCTSHLQFPGSTRRPGEVFAAQTAQRSQPPSLGCPAWPFRIPPHSPMAGGQPPWVGPPWRCYGDLQSAPSSKFPSRWQEFMPWVLGCPACTIWPGAKHLITGLLPGVSQAGTTIQCLALVFPIDPGEGRPTENSNTSGLLCCIPSAPPAQHKPSLLALGLSSSILPWGSSPVLSMPGPLSPHLLLSWQ